MKNYLIYIRVDKKTSEDISTCNQAYMLDKFARNHCWNVIDYVVENVESLKRGSFSNLRRYLRDRTDIGFVVTAELEHINCWVDSSAIKTILDKKKIKLITISICPASGNKPIDKSSLVKP